MRYLVRQRVDRGDTAGAEQPLQPDSAAIAEAPYCRMSTANFLEAALVVEGRAGLAGGHELDLFIEKAAT